MSRLEKRAWLMLWSMCPGYLVYFVIQAGFPELLPTLAAKLTCLTMVAGLHAAAYLSGLLVLRRQERDETLLEDDRDRAIDARATRAAYFLLLTGMLLVGVVMPFDQAGWAIVNAGLLFVVASETLRYVLIVVGYRRPRFAH